MTALKLCAVPRCLAVTAHDTDGLRGALAETVCLEHMARGLGLPCDALEGIGRLAPVLCHHRGCETPAKEITTWGNYCAQHFMMRRRRK